MTIGIVGLGLIGGSLAKAVASKNGGSIVLGYDISESVCLEAELFGAINGRLTDENLSECDIVLIAVYPAAVIDYIKRNKLVFKKDSFVIDCAGIKRAVCSEAEKTASENGFYFLGGHPMAGTQFSGFRHSRGSLFKNASMILCAGSDIDIVSREQIKKFFISLEFGEVVFTSPEEHDRIIAYTSQLAHIVSNAYIKSPAAEEHKGFSAGSYKDLTRVARLNENMWTELFLYNGDNLVKEIDCLIENLSEYRNALAENDREKLYALLKDGRERKEKVERGIKNM